MSLAPISVMLQNIFEISNDHVLASDYGICHTASTPEWGTKNIIVRLVQRTKRNFLVANSNKIRVNTSTMGLGDVPALIGINEHLTRQNEQLLGAVIAWKSDKMEIRMIVRWEGVSAEGRNCKRGKYFQRGWLAEDSIAIKTGVRFCASPTSLHDASLRSLEICFPFKHYVKHCNLSVCEIQITRINITYKRNGLKLVFLYSLNYEFHALHFIETCSNLCDPFTVHESYTFLGPAGNARKDGGIAIHLRIGCEFFIK